MSDAAKDLVKRWFNDEPEGWSLGIARDMLALEDRVAAMEGKTGRSALDEIRDRAREQAYMEQLGLFEKISSSPPADGEWRMLEAGEMIEDGDQVLRQGSWSPTHCSPGGPVIPGWVGHYRRRVKPATPAADGDALRAECDRLRAENAALRQQIAAPVDVDAFRPEFWRWFQSHYHDSSMEKWDPFRDGIYWLADRLNAAARKEVAGE